MIAIRGIISHERWVKGSSAVLDGCWREWLTPSRKKREFWKWVNFAHLYANSCILEHFDCRRLYTYPTLLLITYFVVLTFIFHNCLSGACPLAQVMTPDPVHYIMTAYSWNHRWNKHSRIKLKSVYKSVFMKNSKNHSQAKRLQFIVFIYFSNNSLCEWILATMFFK